MRHSLWVAALAAFVTSAPAFENSTYGSVDTCKIAATDGLFDLDRGGLVDPENYLLVTPTMVRDMDLACDIQGMDEAGLTKLKCSSEGEEYDLTADIALRGDGKLTYSDGEGRSAILSRCK